MQEIRDQTGNVVEVHISAEDFMQAGLLSRGGIILPGHPLYDATLGQHLPPGWREQALNSIEGVPYFVYRQGSALMTPVTEAELTEYTHGGEYEERLAEIGETQILQP